MELATTAGAIDYTRESIQNGKTEKEPAFVKVLDQIDERRTELFELIQNYEALRSKIYRQIETLPAEQAKVLYKRYFEYKKLERVAIDINYSFYGTRSIFRAGIRNFNKMYWREFDNG